MRAHDAADCCADETTGIADAILNEIADLLERFAADGEPVAVDLRGLPMTDADRAVLERRLGVGEVRAAVDVAGVSEVWETSYAGVWWVRHRGSDGRIASEEIAIARVPEILMSQKDDVRDAALRLRLDLARPAVANSTNLLEIPGAQQETSHAG